jgi:uncharacterized lipoprotein YbaY
MIPYQDSPDPSLMQDLIQITLQQPFVFNVPFDVIAIDFIGLAALKPF